MIIKKNLTELTEDQLSKVSGGSLDRPNPVLLDCDGLCITLLTSGKINVLIKKPLAAYCIYSAGNIVLVGSPMYTGDERTSPNALTSGTYGVVYEIAGSKIETSFTIA